MSLQLLRQHYFVQEIVITPALLTAGARGGAGG
jgi:hypothetical protein